ncbi:MAG: ethylbenzene dehydrogenase-related protein [Candidatus Hodarchaeales archaeon]
MIKRKILSILLVTMFLVSTSMITQSAAEDYMLTAEKIDESIMLDGVADEEAWENAVAVEDSDVDSSGNSIMVKAIHDETHIYVYAEWTDNSTTESNTRRAFDFNGTHWTNLRGSEDRMNFAWAVGDEAIVCGHNAGKSGGDTMLFDIWHWKATRTGPAGWADDKNWDGSGRHSDAKTAGGYKDNSVVAQAVDAAAITAALGNTSDVSAHSSDDRPFWKADGTAITWTAGTTTDITSATVIPGYLTEIPTGSRGDVLTGSKYASGTWSVEFKRELDTNNTDDIMFEEGKTYTFYMSFHDNSGDASHFVVGGSPQAYELEIASASSSAPGFELLAIMSTFAFLVSLIIVKRKRN